MADVFISYSTKDEELANLVCKTLEEKGIKCWISHRDLEGGSAWSGEITDAIHDSKVFIVLCSENSAASVHVPRELTLAGDSNRVIIPYRTDNAKMGSEFDYYLASSHWVNANAANKDLKLDELEHAVASALKKQSQGPSARKNRPEKDKSISSQNEKQSVPQQQAEPAEKTIPQKAASGAKLSGKKIVAAIIAAAVVLAVLLTVVKGSGNAVVSSEAQSGASAFSEAQSSASVSTETQNQNAGTAVQPEQKQPEQDTGAEDSQYLDFPSKQLLQYDTVDFAKELDLSQGGVQQENLAQQRAQIWRMQTSQKEMCETYGAVQMDFKAEYAPNGTQWNLANVNLDLSDLKKEHENVEGGKIRLGLEKQNDRIKLYLYCEDVIFDGRVIEPSLIYSVKDASDKFVVEDSKGKYVSYISWEPQEWYRIYLQQNYEKTTGHEQIELWMMKISDNEWQKVCVLDTKLAKAGFTGVISGMMENSDRQYCTELRSIQVSNFKIYDNKNEEWLPLHDILVGIDTRFDDTKGTYAFGATDTSVWGITCGAGDLKCKQGSDITSWKTIQRPLAK